MRETLSAMGSLGWVIWAEGRMMDCRQSSGEVSIKFRSRSSRSSRLAQALTVPVCDKIDIHRSKLDERERASCCMMVALLDWHWQMWQAVRRKGDACESVSGHKVATVPNRVSSRGNNFASAPKRSSFASFEARPRPLYFLDRLTTFAMVWTLPVLTY